MKCRDCGAELGTGTCDDCCHRLRDQRNNARASADDHEQARHLLATDLIALSAGAPVKTALAAAVEEVIAGKDAKIERLKDVLRHWVATDRPVGGWSKLVKETLEVLA